MMADAQSVTSDGDGDSSCFAADDHRSWSCDSNGGTDTKKDYDDDDNDEPGYKHGVASQTDHADISGSSGKRAAAATGTLAASGGGGSDGGGGGGSKERRRRRQKLANKDNLMCQVCGDKANGYNFGAVTCESCKAFFRRNALKNWDIKCNFEGSCKIDPFTRKFCTACRLQKCFAINMKKEWILDEEALKKRKKLSRRPSGAPPSVAADSCLVDEGQSVDGSQGPRRRHALPPPAAPAIATAPEAAVVASADSSASVVVVVRKHSSTVSVPATATSTVASAAAAAAAFRTMLPSQPGGNSMAVGACSSSSPPCSSVVAGPADACCSAVASCGGDGKAAAAATCGAAAACSVEQTVPLTEDDSRIIASILTNHSQTADPFDRPFWDKVTVEQPTRPQDVYNMADGFIRRLIKFVKVLPEFSSLSQDDQIALLKGGIMETLVIRSAYTYDPSIGGFKITSAETHEQRELKIAMMFRGLGDELYTEHMKFITSFNTCAKWNKTIIVLAMVINLLSPDRQGLSSAVKPVVAAAEDRYSQLLLRYLSSLYPGAEAAAMYPRILMKLTDVRSYGEMTARHVARVSATDVEPLMKEIFNLK